MAIEIITQADLQEFRIQLVNDIKQILESKTQQTKPWLRSREVRTLLNISSGTLQNLRINGTLTYSKIGNTIYYVQEDIVKILEKNTVKSQKTLFQP